MTKEIANKIVKGVTDKIEANTADIDDWAEFWGFTREEYEEFLDMRIKALEQEPTTKNDLGVDCISRKEVLRLLANNVGKTNTYLQTKVLKMPSVTPQEPIRPKGRWISYHYGAYYECSNCHERNNSRYDNYCKFCGAKMEAEE